MSTIKQQKTPRRHAAKPQKNGTQARFNAVKTGAYVAGLLPWENFEEYKQHRAELFKLYGPEGEIENSLVEDMAANRWQRKRLRLMTTIATYRHAFGQAMEESGVQSWQEAESFIGKYNMRHRKVLDTIAASMLQTVEIAAKRNSDGEASQPIEEIFDVMTKNGKLLEGIDAKLDLERDFFERYMPQKLEQRIRLENLLDAQFDKLHVRLLMLQEARREELFLSGQQAIGVSLLLDKSANAEKPPSDVPGTEPDALDREETGQPSGDGGDEVDLDADDDAETPPSDVPGTEPDALNRRDTGQPSGDGGDEVDLDADDEDPRGDPFDTFIEAR